MDIAATLLTDIGRLPKGERRRRAFEANLTGNLEEAFGDALHPETRRRLVKALGAAHEDVAHLIDARAAAGSGRRRWYAVLQFGAVRRMPDIGGAGPLAIRVLRSLDDGALADLSERERRVLAICVERSEIRNFHPLDWRPRLRIRSLQIYLNLLAGRDRRGAADRATDERRAPHDERAGLVVLTAIVLLLAGTGLWLIGGALLNIASVAVDPRSAELVNDLFGG